MAEGAPVTPGRVKGILDRAGLLAWVGSMARTHTVHGPTLGFHGDLVFDRITDPRQLTLPYGTPMLAPRKFVYPSREVLFRISRSTLRSEQVLPKVDQVLFGVHSCDVHALLVLDRLLLVSSPDPWYRARRLQSLVVALNCNDVGPLCFCASLGTGPHLHVRSGYDILMTVLEGPRYLVEAVSDGGARLLAGAPLADASEADEAERVEQEKVVLARFKKKLSAAGLPELYKRNQEHDVWARVGEGRCLNCSNCVLVCPTCYCYDVRDEVSIGKDEVLRTRVWDACQDIVFAEVHGGNFRSSRGARLRQFITHKLGHWHDQYGCFGCVGCGRCIRYCPTDIDLVEITKEIQAGEERYG